MSGRAEPLLRLLIDLESLSDTPLARLARTTRQRLADCEHVEGRAGAGEGLGSSLACVEPAAADPVLEDLRDGDDFVFVLPVAGVRLTGRGRVGADGGVTVDLELPEPVGEGPVFSLLPRAGAVGPAVMSRRDALILARLGSDRGLDLASAVEAGGTVDSFYNLRSRLFSRAVLTGVWEVAVYGPDEGDPVLPLAVAVEGRSDSLLRAAIGEFLSDLESSWPFLRRPFQLGPDAGECLDEMRVLPGLAPCYVIHGSALVAGWNAAAMEKALSGEASDEMAGDSRLVIELDRFPAAEERLTRSAYGDETEILGMGYPWRRAIVSGRRDGGVYRFRVELRRSGAVSPSTPGRTSR